MPGTDERVESKERQQKTDGDTNAAERLRAEVRQEPPQQTLDRIWQERWNYINTSQRDQTAQISQLGQVQGLRDKDGLIRDIDYKQGGDVRFRRIDYDANKEPNHMAVWSQSKGPQEFTRQADGKWKDQHGNLIDMELKIDQKTGTFTCNYGDRTTTYDTNGQRHEGKRVDAGYEAQAEKPKVDEKQQKQNQEAIDNTFKATADDAIDHRINGNRSYKDNLFAAAADGKPMVVTIGRAGDPETANALKQLEEAKKASGGKADYMFVDIDKVDKTSAIGKYAQEEIVGKGFKTPLTMVVTQKEGDKSKNEGPIPERTKENRWWQGGNLDVAKVTQAVEAAGKEQKAISGIDRKFRDENDVLSELDRTHKDGDKEKPNYLDPTRLRERMSGTDSHVVQHDLMQKAIDAADDEAAKAAEKALAAKTNGKPEEYQKLAAEAQKWSTLGTKGRVAEGLMTLHMANEYADRKDSSTDNNRAAFEGWKEGAKLLIAAGAKYAEDHRGPDGKGPSLYDDPQFQEAVKKLDLPGDLAKTIFERGKQNPEWFAELTNREATDAERDAALNKVLSDAILKEASAPAVVDATPPTNNYNDFGAPNTVRPIGMGRGRATLPVLELK